MITLNILWDITASLLALFAGTALLAILSGKLCKKIKQGVFYNLLDIVYEGARYLCIISEVLLMIMMFVLAFASAENIAIRWRLGWI